MFLIQKDNKAMGRMVKSSFSSILRSSGVSSGEYHWNHFRGGAGCAGSVVWVMSAIILRHNVSMMC